VTAGTRPGPPSRAGATGYPRATDYPRVMRGRLDRRWRSALFDLMVAGSIGLLAPLGGLRGVGPIGLGMAAAVLVRRRYPLVVMTAVSALALLQVLLFPPRADPRPFDIAVLVAMYSVVKYGRRRWHGLLAAVPVVIGAVIEVVRHLPATSATGGMWRAWGQSLFFILGFCAAVWLTAFTLRTRRLYVLGLEERAATAEREREHLATIAVAQERATIARELHDVVAHSMAVMIVQADGASYALDQDPEQARIAIKQVAATGRDALEDMRRLVGVLRGAGTDSDAGAADRRRTGLDQLATLADRARSAGLTVTVSEDERPPSLPAAVELTVFRILQETLTNVLRHAAPGARVQLCLRYRPGVVGVEVTDDGGGRLATEPVRAPGAGHGLVGMRERVAVHAGTFAAGPKLGGGWSVTAEIPWT
jgi:signal transduction histidine kinase